MGHDTVAIDLRLSPGPRAPGEARRTVAARLGPMDPALLARLGLLVSEVVSNSVRHGQFGDRTAIQLSARRDGRRIRVEVTDPGDGFSANPRRPEADSPTGWGLYLVDRLADRWGVTADGETNVWFELRC